MCCCHYHNPHNAVEETQSVPSESVSIGAAVFGQWLRERTFLVAQLYRQLFHRGRREDGWFKAVTMLIATGQGRGRHRRLLLLLDQGEVDGFGFG